MQSYSLATTEPTTYSQLGESVLVCRNHRRADAEAALGRPWPQMIWLTLVLAAICTAPFVFVLLHYFPVPPPIIEDPFVGTVTAAIYLTFLAGWLAFAFGTPRRPILVLCERGFRYRQQIIKFEDVKTIHLGRKTNSYHQGSKNIANALSDYSWQAQQTGKLLKLSERSTIEVEFLDGTMTAMANVYLVVFAEDVTAVFANIRERHSKLFPPSQDQKDWSFLE